MFVRSLTFMTFRRDRPQSSWGVASLSEVKSSLVLVWTPDPSGAWPEGSGVQTKIVWSHSQPKVLGFRNESISDPTTCIYGYALWLCETHCVTLFLSVSSSTWEKLRRKRPSVQIPVSHIPDVGR